ncbi:MAG: prolipoprotein diacylglyceryl transferase [Chloroflexi bacterium]|nr:prolipoprotein diacylglyceryl transferase [Chloroflexota bacterium]
MIVSQLDIGPFTIPVFSAMLAGALALGLGSGVYRLRGQTSAGRAIDAYLAALIGGLIGARAGHVLLHWPYFAAHPDEIIRLNAGGLDPHGALIGGLIGFGIMVRWRGIPAADRRRVLDAAAPALALIALAGWIGCVAAGCGYGAEVATLAAVPPPIAAELPDRFGIGAPRYNTQIFGAGLALVALGALALLDRRDPPPGARFWLTVALLYAGLFVVGFLRGDSVPLIFGLDAGLRADQALNLLLMGGSGWRAVGCWRA